MKIKNFTLSIVLLIGMSASVIAQNPGDLDPTFATDGFVVTAVPFSSVEAYQDVAIQTDQKIVAVGMSWDSVQVAEAYAVRYNTDGSLDTDFGVNGFFTYALDVEALAFGCVITEEGKIILAGATTDLDKYKVLLIQLNPDGTLDNSFGQGGVVVHQFSPATQYFEDFARDIVLDANGNILICGSSYDEYETEVRRRPYVARFTPDGNLDTDFGVDGIATIPVVEQSNSFNCLMIQPDGKILAAGDYAPLFLLNVMIVARFKDDGTIDENFGDEGIVLESINATADKVFNMAMTPDGNIILAGFSANSNYQYRGALVQLTPDGSIDTSFGTNGVVLEDEELYNVGTDIQVQADGKIYLSGTTGIGPPNTFDMVVWKYNADGSRDTGFGVDGEARHDLGGNTMLLGLALQADNKVVVVGQWRDETNDIDFLVVRMDNDIVDGIFTVNKMEAPTLSPNPTSRSNQLNIQFSEPVANNAMLEFYSISGKLLHSIQIKHVVADNQSLRIQVPSVLTNGVYLICVSQNGIKSIASKLVILD